MVWLACSVETGCESKVVRWGLERGHELYCPFGVRMTKPKGKRQAVSVDVAAYPGYIFGVQGPGIEDLHEQPDFYDFVRFGGKVAIVRDEVMERVRAAEAKGIFNEDEAIPSDLKLGQLVEVREGVAMSLKGTVEWKTKQKVKLTGGDFRNGAFWCDIGMVQAV